MRETGARHALVVYYYTSFISNAWKRGLQTHHTTVRILYICICTAGTGKNQILEFVHCQSVSLKERLYLRDAHTIKKQFTFPYTENNAL